MATTTINVQGMGCNHCKMAVEKALKNLAGVSAAEVSLEANNVTVTYDPDQVGEDKMKAAIREVGYEA